MEEERVKKFIKAYEEIKEQSFIIANINKDFFFEFAECLTKRIKELEKNQKQMCEEYCPKSNLYLNSISKQKIKDKIEKEIKYHERNILDIENITMLKSKTAKEEAEIEFNKYAIVVLKKMLQELLEGRK